MGDGRRSGSRRSYERNGCGRRAPPHSLPPRSVEQQFRCLLLDLCERRRRLARIVESTPPILPWCLRSRGGGLVLCSANPALSISSGSDDETAEQTCADPTGARLRGPPGGGPAAARVQRGRSLDRWTDRPQPRHGPLLRLPEPLARVRRAPSGEGRRRLQARIDDSLHEKSPSSRVRTDLQAPPAARRTGFSCVPIVHGPATGNSGLNAPATAPSSRWGAA